MQTARAAAACSPASSACCRSRLRSVVGALAARSSSSLCSSSRKVHSSGLGAGPVIVASAKWTSEPPAMGDNRLETCNEVGQRQDLKKSTAAL